MRSSEFNMSNVEAVTPDMMPSIEYMDADDELAPMASSIKQQTPHNMELNIDRIKFLYTNKAKKEGGKYTMGQLIVRNETERAVYDSYDYILLVYHPTWKDLDKNNKFIQLDKLLCGVDVEVNKAGQEAIKKAAYDCREYTNNMHYWGADIVLKSSEMIHLAVSRHIEEMKENSKKNDS